MYSYKILKYLVLEHKTIIIIILAITNVGVGARAKKFGDRPRDKDECIPLLYLARSTQGTPSIFPWTRTSEGCE